MSTVIYSEAAPNMTIFEPAINQAYPTSINVNQMLMGFGAPDIPPAPIPPPAGIARNAKTKLKEFPECLPPRVNHETLPEGSQKIIKAGAERLAQMKAGNTPSYYLRRATKCNLNIATGEDSACPAYKAASEYIIQPTCPIYSTIKDLGVDSSKEMLQLMAAYELSKGKNPKNALPKDAYTFGEYLWGHFKALPWRYIIPALSVPTVGLAGYVIYKRINPTVE